jgi:hypothetical protein
MAPKTRGELKVELAKLRKQHYEAIANATFGGFTPKEEAAHQQRAQLIASLVQQLEAHGRIVTLNDFLAGLCYEPSSFWEFSGMPKSRRSFSRSIRSILRLNSWNFAASCSSTACVHRTVHCSNFWPVT